MADGPDPAQVGHLTLEPAGRERQLCKREHLGVILADNAFDLDATVGSAGQKQVDDAQRVPVAVRRHHCETKPFAQ